MKNRAILVALLIAAVPFGFAGAKPVTRGPFVFACVSGSLRR
ncbi:hypothetical protein WOA01_18325 [Methylocystis sp. IM2]